MKIQSLLGTACLLFTPLALADDHASGEAEWAMGNPVEIYGCSFKEGVDGYKQSVKHAAFVNAWAEKHDAFQNLSLIHI